MNPKFLLVAILSQELTDLMAFWKQMLKIEIGKFVSWDSKAHITIAFFYDLEEVDHYIARIRTFCKTVIPTEVTFDKFVYGKETFLIEPNNVSKKYINEIIRGLHKHIGKTGDKPSSHASIGRKLNEGYITIASEIFKDIQINYQTPFVGLHLLKFCSKKRHYSETIKTFKFTGKQQPDLFS